MNYEIIYTILSYLLNMWLRTCTERLVPIHMPTQSPLRAGCGENMRNISTILASYRLTGEGGTAEESRHWHLCTGQKHDKSSTFKGSYTIGILVSKLGLIPH